MFNISMITKKMPQQVQLLGQGLEQIKGYVKIYYF